MTNTDTTGWPAAFCWALASSNHLRVRLTSTRVSSQIAVGNEATLRAWAASGEAPSVAAVDSTSALYSGLMNRVAPTKGLPAAGASVASCSGPGEDVSLAETVAIKGAPAEEPVTLGELAQEAQRTNPNASIHDGESQACRIRETRSLVI